MEAMYQTVILGLAILLISMLLLKRFLPTPIIKVLYGVIFLSIVFGIKLQGLTLVEYLYGYTSNLSIITAIVVLMGLISFVLDKQCSVWQKNLDVLMWVSAVSGLILYPLSLVTITSLYPYAWGYNVVILPALCLILGLVLLWKNIQYLSLFIIFLITAGLYLIKYPNGDNFWNYLIDPFVWIFSMGYLSKKIFVLYYPSKKLTSSE